MGRNRSLCLVLLWSIFSLSWGQQLIIPTTLTECETATIQSVDMVGETWTLAVYFVGATSPAETVSCSGATCPWLVDFPHDAQISFCNLLDGQCSTGTLVSTGTSTSCLAQNPGASVSIIQSAASSLGQTVTSLTTTSSSSSSSGNTLAPGSTSSTGSSSSSPSPTTAPPSKTMSQTSSTSSSSATELPASSGGSSSNTGAIAGGVVGGVVVLGAAILLIGYYSRRNTHRRREAAHAALSGTIYDNSSGGGMEELGGSVSAVESWTKGVDQALQMSQRSNNGGVRSTGSEPALERGAYIQPRPVKRSGDKRKKNSDAFVPTLPKSGESGASESRQTLEVQPSVNSSANADPLKPPTQVRGVGTETTNASEEHISVNESDGRSGRRASLDQTPKRTSRRVPVPQE